MPSPFRGSPRHQGRRTSEQSPSAIRSLSVLCLGLGWRGLRRDRIREILGSKQRRATGLGLMVPLDDPQCAHHRRVAVGRRSAVENVGPGDGFNALADVGTPIVRVAPARVGRHCPRMGRQRLEPPRPAPVDEFRPVLFPPLSDHCPRPCVEKLNLLDYLGLASG